METNRDRFIRFEFRLSKELSQWLHQDQLLFIVDSEYSNTYQLNQVSYFINQYYPNFYSVNHSVFQSRNDERLFIFCYFEFGDQLCRAFLKQFYFKKYKVQTVSWLTFIGHHIIFASDLKCYHVRQKLFYSLQIFLKADSLSCVADLNVWALIFYQIK